MIEQADEIPEGCFDASEVVRKAVLKGTLVECVNETGDVCFYLCGVPGCQHETPEAAWFHFNAEEDQIREFYGLSRKDHS